MTTPPPNPAAPHRRPLVGVLIDGTSKYGRSILRGVTRYANLHRRWVLFKDLNRVIESHTDWPGFDGIIYGGISRPAIERCHAVCANVVACSFASDPALSPVVAIDSRVVGVQAARHLIDCRLRHFAFYGKNEGRVAAERLGGFRDELRKHGFDVSESPVRAPSHAEWMDHTHRPALVAWLSGLHKPIGIFAYDDVVAHDIAETCLEAGIAVPEQVAIIGVNNDDLMCESAWPPLSSVEADHAPVGYRAAQLLDRLLAGESIPAEQRLTLLPPGGVQQRQSTDLAFLHDEHLSAAMRHIREHACDPCTVLDVLRAVPVNRRWLERQFADQFGRTPHDEIRRVRIETAQRLLTQTDLTLPQIAARCGFEELKSFYVAFKAITGSTPAAQRRSAADSGGRRIAAVTVSQNDSNRFAIERRGRTPGGIALRKVSTTGRP